MKNFRMQMDDETHRIVKMLAAQWGMTMPNVVTYLIHQISKQPDEIQEHQWKRPYKPQTE